MQNEDAKGITDVSLIKKYLDKLMDTEVTEFYKIEKNGGKKRYINSVMNIYLKQDVKLDFMEDFFDGHCSYAEMLSAVLNAGRKAKAEKGYNYAFLPKEDQEMISYECTALDGYYWAIGLIASALLQYADSNIVGQMFCDINIKTLGKYAGSAKWSMDWMQENFLNFDKLEDCLGKDVRDKTIGYVVRQLLSQVGSVWKCGVESLLIYRDRVRDAQEKLEEILCEPLMTLYPDRFKMTPLKQKYATPRDMDKEQEAGELCGGF